ncbi:hypothetical protein EV646_1191 [Kribbella antiqua]|uniref:Uncharacterized protein n=2 Tax=Kribbella antiqua TaxID=2512217 RepID=A0A4R2I459_9ACTN|nr:hypothetical protein EV646_1191 [Kribbella antiqua]
MGVCVHARGAIGRVALMGALLACLASCGGQSGSAQPTVTQTMVYVPTVQPSSPAPSVSGGDASTIEGRLATCRELRYFDLAPVTTGNSTVAGGVLGQWFRANESNDDPRWVGCVVEDPSNELGMYIASTHLLTGMVEGGVRPADGSGPERTIEVRATDPQQVEGNWVNVTETMNLHVVFHALAPYKTGFVFLKGLQITARKVVIHGTDLGPGGTYGTM